MNLGIKKSSGVGMNDRCIYPLKSSNREENETYMKWNETGERLWRDTEAEERIGANCLNKVELNVKKIYLI